MILVLAVQERSIKSVVESKIVFLTKFKIYDMNKASRKMVFLDVEH